ncbi:MAG TPA: hypothetical protein ENH82_10375 [bacterium]|nr:hypothetical protein [bacterium]
MRILHIWNTAGVASLMSKYLEKHGHRSEVIMRKSHDPFGMTEYYGHASTDLSGPEFIDHAVVMAKFYDVIHLHGLYRIAAQIKTLYPEKKVVLQHHGTELSQCEDDDLRLESYKSCDAIIASTMDLSSLLSKNGVEHYLLDNAVDTEIFKPMDNINKSELALMFDIRYLDTESSLKFVNSRVDWDAFLVDREESHIEYKEMPRYLNAFKRYIDVKCYEWTKGHPGKAYSKTGREALACGLEVLNYRGDIVKGLPAKFTPEVMVEKLIGIYEKCSA